MAAIDVNAAFASPAASPLGGNGDDGAGDASGFDRIVAAELAGSGAGAGEEAAVSSAPPRVVGAGNGDATGSRHVGLAGAMRTAAAVSPTLGSFRFDATTDAITAAPALDRAPAVARTDGADAITPLWGETPPSLEPASAAHSAGEHLIAPAPGSAANAEMTALDRDPPSSVRADSALEQGTSVATDALLAVDPSSAVAAASTAAVAADPATASRIDAVALAGALPGADSPETPESADRSAPPRAARSPKSSRVPHRADDRAAMPTPWPPVAVPVQGVLLPVTAEVTRVDEPVSSSAAARGAFREGAGRDGGAPSPVRDGQGDPASSQGAAFVDDGAGFAALTPDPAGAIRPHAESATTNVGDREERTSIDLPATPRAHHAAVLPSLISEARPGVGPAPSPMPRDGIDATALTQRADRTYAAHQGTAAHGDATHWAQLGTIGHDTGVAMARGLVEGRDHVSLRLDPPDLGRIDVRLSFTHQGELRAVVAADNRAALDLLRRDVDQLQRALSDAGLRADSGSFHFSERQPSSGQRWYDPTQGDRPRGMDERDPLVVEDAPLPPRRLRSSGRVDVIA